jgi:hypothetical protein
VVTIRRELAAYFESLQTFVVGLGVFSFGRPFNHLQTSQYKDKEN